MSDPIPEAQVEAGRRTERRASVIWGGCWEIVVQGHLDQSWSDWFEGLAITLLANGETLLAGEVVDQAALLGALNRLHGLGLGLISVRHVSRKESRHE
jgi:hypothetical protein